MKKEQLILVGAGGHSLSVIEAIESTGDYDIAGLLDTNFKKGHNVLGYPIIGDDAMIPQLIREANLFHICVGQIESPDIRIKIYNNLINNKGRIVTVAASTSRVSRHATIGNGSTLLHFAFVNAGAKIGHNTILNTGALVEHEAVVGDHCHLSTYAKVNGQVKIGNRVFIGSNATIFNNVTIGDDVIVGSGAVVTRDIPTGDKVIGNPAKNVNARE